jgi:cation diffusion facilitator CzcD-associated flavoprotein CzcO
MTTLSAIIVGTGFGGLGMGIRLKQSGQHDFLILEQADRVGGTWRDNHYPGAACDVESHLYSFSFEPNPGWSRQFAPQAEILAYLERCTEKYGLLPHIRFNTEAQGAQFDEAIGEWVVQCSDGVARRARVLISATGGLSRPAYPDIPGLKSFQGGVFHSARWDDSYPFEGKAVGVIGTGASSIQIVPALAPRVRALKVFQRTPAWILPKADRDITESEQSRFRSRSRTQRFARLRQYWGHELAAFGFTREPRLLKFASGLALRHLKHSIPDPALRQRLTPNYTMGCKRVLLSNDYFPAFLRPNVELVTDGIREIRAHSVVTQDGVERPLDALVLATGFQAAEAVAPFEVRGRRGLDLNTVWKDGPEAHLGTTIAGFPNLFLIVGPNTGLGHSSMVFMIESQLEYILSGMKLLRDRRLRFLDVRPDVQAAFNAELQRKLSRTVWASGCSSWYQTRSGKNTTLWPGYTFEYRWQTRRLKEEEYELV